MRVRFEHDDNCPLGENGLRAYDEARDALAYTPPEALATEQDRIAHMMATVELEDKQRCTCGALEAQQQECIHRVKKTSERGYRYRCVKCGKFLKILSGVLLPTTGEVNQ